MNRKSNNPVLTRVPEGMALAGEAAVSYVGVSIKTLILLGVAVLTAMWPCSLMASTEGVALAQKLMIGGLIGGLVFGFATIFKPRWAPVSSFAYAACEGLFLGGITAIFEASNPGIAVNAGLLTMGLFTAMLVAYGAGVVRVTQRFRMFMIGAIGAIMFAYLINIIMGMFGTQLPFLHDAGMVGLGINVFIIVIAVLSLALDFDLIERMVNNHAPKRYEWYLGFGLMVSLVWIYIEVLRLLGRRD